MTDTAAEEPQLGSDGQTMIFHFFLFSVSGAEPAFVCEIGEMYVFFFDWFGFQVCNDGAVFEIVRGR